MKKAVFFGSIGTLTETSELQRQAYNLAFQDAGLNWHWNVATYCALLRQPGGKKRLNYWSKGALSTADIDRLHSAKERHFSIAAQAGLHLRPGVAKLMDYCKRHDIQIGLITTTTNKTLSLLQKGLEHALDFTVFDLITQKGDVAAEKPDSAIYHHALSQLGLKPHEAIAIEDTAANQGAALDAGIDCALTPGDYATLEAGTPVLASADLLISALDAQPDRLAG